MASRLPVVALVGRPNAGKSMLFNRIVRGAHAIVDSTPGVTRDRNLAPTEWEGRRFLLVDTGGFDDAGGSALATSVRAQSQLAAEEADVVVAVFDGRAGVSPADHDFVRGLRRLPKPLAYAVSKLDTPALDDAAAEFFSLGPIDVFPISGAHGRGVAELLDWIVEHLPSTEEAEAAAPEAVRLAIVGRPNVGKSSLLNRLAGRQRAIVDSTPGTTRDPVDTLIRYDDADYVVVDTAGIRRRPRVHEQLERASVVRALRALERAEVALLVVDATAGVADQDARIAGYAWERGRALVIVLNKWDAVPRERRDRKGFLAVVHHAYPSLATVPAVFLSALTGARVRDLFPAVAQVVATHRRRLQTAELNEVLRAAVAAHAPPTVRRKQPRLYYATQTGTAPPQISIFTSAPKDIAASYQRYLVNAFRDRFSLWGTPLRLRFRSRRKERD